MNYRRLILGTLLVGLYLWPTARATMTDRSAPFLTLPQPPAAGRAAERRAQAYLTRPDTTYATWMKNGRGYLARKEFEQAIWAFRKALRLKPLSSEAHFLLGYAFERRGLEGLPGDVTAWDVLAEAEYRSAIALDDHLPARHNLGRLLERLERYEEARHEFEHILTIAPRGRLAARASAGLDRTIDADLEPARRSAHLPAPTSGGGK
ncbi:MAG TPA: tetratricopeptide repeat protein [Candidatus Ozemobacteraceae bacterium]|nr:tetratricopeptide repeat protein [Candidatus Ozemobacteraceae bacterium]